MSPSKQRNLSVLRIDATGLVEHTNCADFLMLVLLDVLDVDSLVDAVAPAGELGVGVEVAIGLSFRGNINA